MSPIVTPGIGLIFWTALIFILVLVLLTKFAWKPMLSALQSREESIQTALDTAKKAQEDIKKLQTQNDQMAKEALLEREKILKEARATAVKIVEDSQSRATAEYNKTLMSAKADIEREKEIALKEIRNQLAELSLNVAEKLVKKNLSSDSAQKALVSDYIKDLKLN
ncbi:MAG: ATP synthase F0 subunit B [Cytophagales bacterium]|nr:MAG: ATP synthase F0 subunit B [Cytophagales bacterium]TAF61281.1 MAG: ATP synthase F0 subunit B [Cytophagales bacterium]